MKSAAHTAGVLARKLSAGFRSLGPNVRLYIVYGILYDIMFNLYKPYAAKFAERLGGTELHISLITSMPGFFAVAALIPGSLLLTKLDKKKATAVLFAVSRSFLVIMALTPFLPEKYRAWAFVIALSVMNLPDALSQASLQGFLGDLFKPREIADAISIRSKFGNMATTVALIFSCVALQFAASGNEGKIRLYQIFYIVAFLFGVAEIYVFTKLSPTKTSRPVPFNFKESFPLIARDKKFITYCLAMFAFHFVYFMGFPVSNILLIKTLGANELWVGLSTVTNISAIMLASKFCGRALKKRGTGVVLAVSAAGLALNCLFMSIVPNPQVYALSAFFGGLFTCGVNLGVLNGLLEATPDSGRVVYVGVFQTFVNFTLAVAPLFGLMATVRWDVYRALWLIGALRVSCALMIFVIYRKKTVV